MKCSIDQAAKVLGAQILCNGAPAQSSLCGVVTDSRAVTKDCLFVARVGEESDGHDFLESAAEKGASCFLVNSGWAERQFEPQKPILAGIPHLAVQDTTEGLSRLAGWWRTQLTAPVVLVTGSNGKTTTKEMLRQVLEFLVGRGVASEKSYNNHVGLPLTVLRADKEDKWLVLEAGMNHPGELDFLGSIAKPDVAMILNVGPAHIGAFGSLDAIADAKCEVLSHVVLGGRGIIFGDDQILLAGASRVQSKVPELEVKTFGLSPDSFCQLKEEQSLKQRGSQFTVSCRGEQAEVFLPLLGAHNVRNALAVISVIKTLFPERTLLEIAAAFKEARAPNMRFESFACGELILVNDAYNANPVSMKASLLAAKELAEKKRLVAILGDMKELGEESERFHREIGEAVPQSGVKTLIGVGDYAEVLCQGGESASSSLQTFVAQNAEEAGRVFLEQVYPEADVVLVKGSRAMGLERTIEIITESVRRGT